MYRVVLVDDEQFILQGLQRAFPWQDYQCEVVGTAGNGREGIALVQRLHPDILLTDIRMPNMDGLEMIAALVSEQPSLQISVLTAFRDFDYARQAMHLGVSRFLLKPSKMEELREAVAHMTQQLPSNPTLSQVPEQKAALQEANSFVARNALRYIEQHFTEHISLSDVAEHVYVSQWHLSKLINGNLGESFFDIVNRLRVERAKELLQNANLKVHEIALMVGYGDVAHFSRNFKKTVGQSPMEYRSNL